MHARLSLYRRFAACFSLAFLVAWNGTINADERPENALYWRITQEEREAGYLLGTIHSEDPRVLDFSTAFLAQLNSCQLFAMEMVPDLPTLTRLTSYMHYEDETTLQQALGAERYERVMAALSGYQVPEEWKARMKIWAVMMTLSVPPPETGFFMDLSLSLRAAGSGLKVTGLETLEQQLSFLENMPMQYQISLLDQALLDYANVGAVHGQMVDAYLSGDLEVISRLSDEQFKELAPDIRDYFVSLGIDGRNRRMVANLLPLLLESRVFVAVGALHLPGPQGLVSLLREQGYTLTALPLPFLPGP
jgi:uncharacterized protein YbaP (TraB family)